MIKFSSFDDIPAMTALWQEAFGDDESFISAFFKSFYTPQNAPITVIDGEVAAMLFLLDGEMSVGGKRYPAYYLYAACTKESHRGKGLMTELLDFSAKTAADRRRAFICLKPGEKGLFDFYEKRGYLPAFGRKVFTVHRSETDILKDFNDKDADFEPFELREAAFGSCDRFIWDKNSVNKAVKLSLCGGDKLFKSCQGYSLYSIRDRICTVKEFAFSCDFTKEFASYIFNNTDCESIEFSLACSAPCAFGAAYECSGAALPLTKEATSAIKNVDNAYLGLTLD